MAFENINVESLKASLNACKSELNKSISVQLIDSIANDNIWMCESRNNLRNALKKLSSIYLKLETQLRKDLSLCNNIEAYKKLQNENRELENKYNNLNNRLYYDERYERWYEDYETKKWLSTWDTRRVKDVNVEREMNDIKRKIRENETKMESEKNNVYNSL